VDASIDILVNVQTGPFLVTNLEQFRPGSVQSYIPLLVAALTFIATLLMLYYARQLNKWTRQQLHPVLVCTGAQGFWYKMLPDRIEVKLTFINPGVSLIGLAAHRVTRWDGEKVELFPGWDIPIEERIVKRGVPVAPHQDWDTTLVIPFSHLPTLTHWEDLRARLGPRGDGIRLIAEVDYMTGPDGSSHKTLELCFRLWGDLPAADGSLLGVHQVECG